MQPKNEYMICPGCGGSGKKQFGLACSHCSGMGMGIFEDSAFYFWGPKLGIAYIELSQARRRAHIMVNIIAFVIGLLGLFALGAWIISVSETAEEITSLAFWRYRDSFLLAFWLSLIADMFVFYRISQEAASRPKIVTRKQYAANRQPAPPPTDWMAIKKNKSIAKIDVSHGYDQMTMQIVEEAYHLAKNSGHRHLEIMHMFVSGFRDKQIAALFSRLNLDGTVMLTKIKKQIEGFDSDRGSTDLANAVKKALVEAYFDARDRGQSKVKPMNLLLPAISGDLILGEILFDQAVDRNKIDNVITWFEINDRLIESYEKYRKKARYKPSSTMDRAYTAVATPALNQFAYDLTIAAKWGRLEFCVARETEIERVFSHFESRHNAVILVGAVGVGKKTIVDGIAQLMVKEDVPEFLQDKRLVEVDVARLVSGADPAQAEERMLIVIDEVARSGNIVLYFRDIENVIGITAGSEESIDLSEVLVSALERRGIYCIASATDRNYHKYIEGRPLGNIMAKVDVEEPAGNRAIQIIESKIGGMEGKYGVYFSYNAIEEVLTLSQRYIHDRYLPEKAVEILESVAVRVAKLKGRNGLVTRDDIAEVISDMVRIPVTKITESESSALLKLEDRIHARMINQEEAVRMVAASLRRARTELREGTRPIANFLFLGPTGVGKTELAKTVSEVYFGEEKYMIRLDMSEYQHADSVEKMIGDPDGTLGYLTEAVRKSPFSLVLLDEFEKAHPDILNLFLQVMDDGRLTDGQGRTIDFTNAIIIATSNAGAHFIQKQVTAGAKAEDIKQTLIDEHLTQVMRPELINRFDGVIVFEPLKMEHVEAIARLMLGRIGKMLDAKGIGFSMTEAGVNKLAQAGYDPKFGARPLRRLLQERVENEIANKILAGELKRRDTVIIAADTTVRVKKGREL